MTELEHAEEALTQATERARELAAMGSLELHAAVTGGPGHASTLLGYHQRLFELNQAMMLAWMRVRDLRAAQGLPPLQGRPTQVTPDFGPTPIPPPGSNVLTGKESSWVGLLGALNARDPHMVAARLEELDGWIFQRTDQP